MATWKLLDENGKEAEIGSLVMSFRGETYTLVGAIPPRHEGSTGRAIVVEGGREMGYFPSVFGLHFLKIIEPEDVSAKLDQFCDTLESLADAVKLETGRTFAKWRAQDNCEDTVIADAIIKTVNNLANRLANDWNELQDLRIALSVAEFKEDGAGA